MKPQPVETGTDGLPVIVQGPWSLDKLYFVGYFAELFSSGMKNKWPTRIYVDLLAGPGRCRDSSTGTDFDGSPLRALACRTPFSKYFFNDIDRSFIDALSQRQEAQWPEATVEYSNLDCNIAASQIGDRIPEDALTLAFIDPWNYEITFDAIVSLAEKRRIDVIVTFHSFAIKRNARIEVAAVDRFLDDLSWRERYWSSLGDPSNPPTTILIDTFRAKLKERLKYDYFGDPAVIKNTNGSTIFHLLFASHASRGLDFWQKSCAKLRSGQRILL